MFVIFLFCFSFPIFFFCFPVIRAPVLHRLQILSVLVLILLLVFYTFVLLLGHCHFVCFQFFFNLVIHTL